MSTKERCRAGARDHTPDVKEELASSIACLASDSEVDVTLGHGLVKRPTLAVDGCSVL